MSTCTRILFVFLFTGLSQLAMAQHVALNLDCSEAEKALAILEKQNAGTPVDSSDWVALFATYPYQKLKAREMSVHNAFTDESFRSFLQNPDMRLKTAVLRRTLNDWLRTNIDSIGRTVLSYLPAGARIRAKVFVVIKPAPNSFVWGTDKDKAIFLYLNPALSREQFANKVAHESHHIGIESMDTVLEKQIAALKEPQKKAIRWLGGFGEGEAMLAAAGSCNVHPHAYDDSAARLKWDQDMRHFNQDLDSLQRFYENILTGVLDTEEKIDERSEKFRGAQGPWYTVGYRMASLVERYFGRQALVDCYVDTRKLLLKYNAAARLEKEKGNDLQLWSAGFLQELGL